MRKVFSNCVVVSLLLAHPAVAFDTQQVKQFVQANAKDPALVTRIESRRGSRWVKVVGGAVLGATVGIVHAQLTGGDATQEALIGAAAGATIAFAVTKYQERRLATRDQVAAEIGYESTSGYAAGVDTTVTTPMVAAGKQVSLSVSYYAIGPDASEKLKMSRYAAIMTESGRPLRGFAFAPDPFIVAKGGGRFETTMDVTLVSQDGTPVPPGTYTFVWVIDGVAQGADTSSFIVTG